MEFIRYIVNSITLTKAKIDDYLDHLDLGYKDKFIILLGETGVGKSTFINSITESSKCKVSNGAKSCTKDINIVKLFDSGYNYYFVDTPGLNDSMGDSNHISLLKKISKKGILTTIILVHNYNKMRLSKSDIDILKIYMEIFPSENFWEHVLFVESFYFCNLTRPPLIESITEEKDLVDFMDINRINLPKKNDGKSFYINLGQTYNQNKEIFNEIIENIRKMHPLYKSYKENSDFIIKEIEKNDGKILEYKHIKHIEYIDFDNKKIEKTEVIDCGENPLGATNLVQIIVEREKTPEFRNKQWYYCFEKEYLIKYWAIKQYKINNNIYELKSLHEETYESDGKKGEKYRKDIEKQLNLSFHIKNL